MAHKHLPILFSRKPWLFDADEEPNDILQKVDEFVSRAEKHPYEETFARRSAAEFVYSSNLMERTLPVGVSQHATFMCLEAVFRTPEEVDDPVVGWNADGGRNPAEMRAQMVQHCRALQLVGEWSRDASHRLSAAAVCGLHRTLMHNATDAHSGAQLPAGEIRAGGAFTTGHIYPEASMERLERAIDKYYMMSLELKAHFLLSAAVLFYEVIQAHPFQDGNGRLSRLLLAYALARAGVSVRGAADVGAFQGPKALHPGDPERAEPRCYGAVAQQTSGGVGGVDFEELFLQARQL